MSATEDLLQDHIFIRRLQAVIERCYTLLHEGRDVPFGDLIKIMEIIEQFVDQFHHGKEESSYFPETESKDHYSEAIRKFVVEHEFGRRIAKRVRVHLEEYLQGKDVREALARYLKTYSVFILDHTSKEDRFFTDVKQRRSLSDKEERELKQEFERLKHECMRKSGNLVEVLKQLENAEWAR
ncbi:MAG TPA: hemerythrin domain-containing protein [Nitrososphaera sp.]|nr:hemerythrin domain-containing protein [Nitrososphaera sp.]